MKTLRDYIAETEEWIDEPQAGDAFDIELAPDHLIETVIVETTADGIVIEADEHLASLLESRGWIGERMGTYGAVGYGGMGQTFFEKDQVAEHGGGIGPREHWQSMMDEEQELAIPGTKGMDDDQRHAAIMKHYPDAKRVGTTPGVYQTKSGQLVSGIQGVRHLKNETMDEGAMKDLDIELQDYKSMTPQEFERAYGMKKADWAMKHHDLIGKEHLQVDWTGKTGFDYVRETSAYMSRMLELAGVADHRYDKQDDVYHEDQAADVVAKKELDIDAAAKLGQAIDEESTCNMTAEGENCPVHGMAECSNMEEAKYQGREVPLGKPMAGDVKKSKVYVRGPKGNVVKVNFGDKKMKIKKSNPKRRKSFRARHNCANPGPRWKARYWSCRAW